MMKLLLSLLPVIAVFTVDCLGIPNDPDGRDFSYEDHLLKKTSTIISGVTESYIEDSEREMFFDDLESPSKRGRCIPLISCTLAGGYCIKRGQPCNGNVDPRGCRKKKCECCIPETTPVTCPVVTSTPCPTKGLQEVDIANNGGIAKASSSHVTGNYGPMNAFGDSGYWHSHHPYTVPQSLWVEFDNPLRIIKYSFTSRPEAVYTRTDGPSKYIFWASNYGDCTEESHWVTLKEDNSGTPFTNSNDPKKELIENENFYSCYGFKVNDVPGRYNEKPVTIGNIRLFSN